MTPTGNYCCWRFGNSYGERPAAVPNPRKWQPIRGRKLWRKAFD